MLKTVEKSNPSFLPIFFCDKTEFADAPGIQHGAKSLQFLDEEITQRYYQKKWLWRGREIVFLIFMCH